MGYSFAGPKSHHETIIDLLGKLRADEDNELPNEWQGLDWGLLMETIQDHVFSLKIQVDKLTDQVKYLKWEALGIEPFDTENEHVGYP